MPRPLSRDKLVKPLRTLEGAQQQPELAVCTAERTAEDLVEELVQVDRGREDAIERRYEDVFGTAQVPQQGKYVVVSALASAASWRLKNDCVAIWLDAEDFVSDLTKKLGIRDVMNGGVAKSLELADGLA